MSATLLLPERTYRWNFVVLGLDISLFTWRCPVAIGP